MGLETRERTDDGIGDGSGDGSEDGVGENEGGAKKRKNPHKRFRSEFGNGGALGRKRK